MTPFQERCLTVLREELTLAGITTPDLPLRKGQREAFIEGQIGNAQLWIYEDMAEVRYPNFHRVFERPDYASYEQLISAFVQTVIKGVKASS
jgi:hypothetical protein